MSLKNQIFNIGTSVVWRDTSGTLTYNISGEILDSSGTVLATFTTMQFTYSSYTSPGSWSCSGLGSMYSGSTTTTRSFKIGSYTWSSTSGTTLTRSAGIRIKVLKDDSNSAMDSWFASNATVETTTTTVDLTTLNLSSGEHELTVVG